ncbi:MAG: ABC transporter substrate-binding protein, partial [Candidatus Limnocylindrales bacterium]
MAATRESERGRFGRAVVGLVAAVAAVAVAAACGQSGPVATPSIAGSPGGGSTPSAAGSVTVRWFIGVGAGTQPAEVEAEKAFVASYNAVAGGTKIALEVVPNANALDVLRTEIGAGNPPDIVGPIGTAAAGQLPGLFLDLNAEIKAQKFDVGAYEPALLKYLQQGGAQLGLPYVVYPGYIFYSKQIFAKANLP